MQTANSLYVVIMAGGGGLRLWPASRRNQPKQFLDLLQTGRSLLQATYDRAKRFTDPQHILVVTAEADRALVAEQLPAIPQSHILGEPRKCNTAPCLTLANTWIRQQAQEATVLVLSSDQHIPDLDAFENSIRHGIAFCQEHTEALVTFGLPPIRPETGYGYIELAHPSVAADIFKVAAFKEKPTTIVAQQYATDGKHLWNSGIFVWTTSALQQALDRFLPQLVSCFRILEHNNALTHWNELLPSVYEHCPEISIDHGVLERSQDVYVCSSSFVWSDLGTWCSLAQFLPQDAEGNACVGRVLAYDTHSCVVHTTEDQLVTLVGLDDYIVVWHENALLVCPKAREQELKQVVQTLGETLGEKYL